MSYRDLADGRALTAVIQRSGRREVARAVADRLSKFGGGTAEDAKRKLEAAEEEVRVRTVALQVALATLLRSALAPTGVGVDGEAVQAIRARVERLEGRAREPSPQRRSPSPRRGSRSPRRRSPSPLDKGKGKEPAPPASESDDKGAETAAEQRDSKRGRARVLLEQVLARLEEVESKAENAVEQYQQVADDLSVLGTDVLLQSDQIEELDTHVRKRRRRAADAEEPRAQSAKATAEPEGNPPAPTRSPSEADMDIDDASEDGEIRERVDGRSAAPKLVPPPVTPKPADPGLADEMAKLRQQMAAMEQRLNLMQAAAPAKTEAADANKPDAEGAQPRASASSTHRELSLPPSESALSPAVTFEALGKIRQTLCDMSKHLAGLQSRVDAFTNVDIQAMLVAERTYVQDAVQRLLDSKWQETVGAATAAMASKIDEHIARAVPVVVAQEIRALAAKSPNLARTTNSQSAPPPGAGTTPQSPTIPLQQRLSLPNVNDHSV